MSLKIEKIEKCKIKISGLNICRYTIETYRCEIRRFPDSSTPQQYVRKLKSKRFYFHHHAV